MLRFCVLASGSAGNAVVVNVGNETILVDAGISYKDLTKRLRLSLSDINAVSHVFTSHLHKDHCRALPMITKKHRSIIVHSQDTIEHGETITLHELSVTPVEMKHDYDLRCFGFIVQEKLSGNKIGYITDTVTIPCDSLKYFIDCSALIIEFNHDTTLLLDNQYYPDDTKIRVSETHLENSRAGDLLSLLAWDGLKFVVAHHISSQNNHAKLIKYEVDKGCRGMEKKPEVVIASQKIPTRTMVIM